MLKLAAAIAFVAVVYLVVSWPAPFVLAEDVEANEDADKSASADELKARLRLAEEHVRRFELRSLDDDEAIDLIDRPLLAFGDSARTHDNGTLWAWGSSGRPLAFMELFQGAKTGAQWIHAVTLTSSRPVILVAPESGRWEPQQTPLESTPIPDAPSPADKEPARLRQLKDLARRFTAHEFWDPDNSRFELRLLVQPVHRYADPAAEIQDGAAFVIAHGTNPEGVLLIEALGPTVDDAHWHYSLARSSHAEMHVELGGKEIWKTQRASEVNNGRTRSYWLFVSPVETAP
ncbi:MAG TPA: hypothetical protein VGX76_16050 [Pirellulales bacterium]|jgi:hypothetical protein|nr:hypothetical protein [Pirellulales bacterium]